MIKKRSLIMSFFLFIFSIVLLITSTLAWFIARPTEIDNIVVKTGNLEVDVLLEYRLNDQSYGEVINELILSNILPGNRFDFRLTIYNKSNVSGRLTTQMRDITRSVDLEIDMATQLILESTDINNVNNKTIKELINDLDFFLLLDVVIEPSSEPYIYNFSIYFDHNASNEYQNKFLRIGNILVRLDQH